MILSLDLSSVNTGYAIMENGPCEVLPSLITYGNIKPPSATSHPELIRYTYEAILPLIEKYNPYAIVIEDQFAGINIKTMKLLCRISGIPMLIAAQYGCKFGIFSATQIKKAFTGNGKAKKIDMINHATALYDLDKIDDNTADAIAAGYTYLTQEVDADDN